MLCEKIAVQIIDMLFSSYFFLSTAYKTKKKQVQEDHL